MKYTQIALGSKLVVNHSINMTSHL